MSLSVDLTKEYPYLRADDWVLIPWSSWTRSSIQAAKVNRVSIPEQWALGPATKARVLPLFSNPTYRQTWLESIAVKDRPNRKNKSCCCVRVEEPNSIETPHRNDLPLLPPAVSLVTSFGTLQFY